MYQTLQKVLLAYFFQDLSESLRRQKYFQNLQNQNQQNEILNLFKITNKDTIKTLSQAVKATLLIIWGKFIFLPNR